MRITIGDKGKLVIKKNLICFVGPTGNGFCGRYWWSIKAFFRHFKYLFFKGKGGV